MSKFIFTGDFDFLPFRAGMLFGGVPKHPTEGDFHMAVSEVESNEDEVAAHWQLEAIRERRNHAGCKLEGTTLKAVNTRVANRLYQLRNRQG